MKHKFILVMVGILIFLAGIFSNNLFNNNSNLDKSNEPKEIKQENTLSMMIEQTAKKGDYEFVTASSWPTDGYVLNSELSKCENGGEVAWDSDNNTVLVIGDTSDKCYVYFDIYVIPTLAEHVISQFTGVQGENGLYHHDGSMTNGINDGSYRYAGANPNNYVCFGSTDSTCPTDNLYRIIGVFDNQVKLIKATSLGGYKVHKENIFEWSAASLNTSILNGSYLSGLGDYSSKIVTTAWKIGKNNYANTIDVVPLTSYQNEIVNPQDATTYDAKIGLMYVSDYGFAAASSAWTKKLSEYSDTTVTSKNWLYLGSQEWTISEVTTSRNYYPYVFVYIVGYVSGGALPKNTMEVRPTFYLQ